MAQKSSVWHHFVKLAGKFAKCNVCDKKLSYKTTTTNLRKHLQRKHKVDVDTCFKTVAMTEDESNDVEHEKAPDRLWDYFERENQRKVHCAICTVVLNKKESVLLKHLKSNHWKLYNEIMTTEETFEKPEDEDDDKSYSEIVYLDKEFQDQDDSVDESRNKSRSPVLKKAAKLSKPRFSVAEKRKKRYLSNSSDEPVVKKQVKKVEPSVVINQKEEDDEIDKFGKYITCLLKQVPKKVCTKLQMDIVALIMSAKLAAEDDMECRKSKMNVEPEAVVTNYEKTISEAPIIVQPAVIRNDDTNMTINIENEGNSNSMRTIDNRTVPPGNIFYTPVTLLQSQSGNAGKKIFLAIQQSNRISDDTKVGCSPISLVIDEPSFKDHRPEVTEDTSNAERIDSESIGAYEETSTSDIKKG